MSKIERNIACEEGELSDYFDYDELAEMRAAESANDNADASAKGADDDPWGDLDLVSRKHIDDLGTKDKIVSWLKQSGEDHGHKIPEGFDRIFDYAAHVAGITVNEALGFFEKSGSSPPKGVASEDAAPEETDKEFLARLEAMEKPPSPSQLNGVAARIANLEKEGDKEDALAILAKLGVTKKRILAKIKDASAAANEEARQTSGRMHINATLDDLSKQLDTLHKGLVAANDPPYIFQYGEKPSGGVSLARVIKRRGDVRLELMQRDALVHELSSVVSFIATKTIGFATMDVEVAIPPDTRSAFMGSQDIDLPVLKGIVHTPVYSAEGELVDVTGYHEGSQLYFDPSIEIPEVPQQPTQEDVDRAKSLLLDNVFVDFPFNDEFVMVDGEVNEAAKCGDASRANTLAMLLTSFVRLKTGIAPLFVIDKPIHGTGATLLVQAIGSIVSGRPPAQQSLPYKNEELSKTLTTALMHPRDIILFDNVNFHVDSGEFAGMLTSAHYSARVLGGNTEVDVPNNRTWVITANNASFSAELMRRIVPIRLDAKSVDPTKGRTFTHSDLETWIKDNRDDLVWACLVLVQNWVAMGMGEGSKNLASFTPWAQTMSGILEAAGITGFLDNIGDFKGSKTTEVDDDAEFIQEWYRVHEETVVTVKGHLFSMVYETFENFGGQVKVSLPIDARDEAGVKRRFSSWLRRQHGRVFTVTTPKGVDELEVQVVQIGSKKSKRAKAWKLQAVRSKVGALPRDSG